MLRTSIWRSIAFLSLFGAFIQPAIAANQNVQIVNKKSSLCVNPKAGGTANGVTTVQDICTASAKFEMRPTTTSNVYYLVDLKSGRCLDMAGSTRVDGTSFQLWDCKNSRNQQFKVTTVSGYSTLVVQHDSKCMDVSGASTDAGAQVQQYTCNGTDAQKFKLTAAGSTTPPTIDPATLSLSSPAAGASVSGTIKITGVAGSNWANIATYEPAAGWKKVAADVVPSNNAFSINIDSTQLTNGSHTFAIIAFSVGAGQQGGTSKEVDLQVTVNNSTIPSGGKDIDLTGFTLTFSDEFNNLSISSNSPKGNSTWYFWPPYGAAGAYSASQWDAAAFSVSGGILSNKLFKDASGNWHSGNISSMDPTGAGFAQQYGYFEARIKMPDSGTGSWPAFWLATRNGIPAVSNGKSTEEIDIFEWYGVSHDDAKGVVQQASHNWNTDGSGNENAPYLYKPSTLMPDGSQPWKDYHIYGCLVDSQHITWYIDGVQTNQIQTPTEYMNGPFYIMIDYAIGGGWPLSGLKENSVMSVDWVRVYALPPGR